MIKIERFSEIMKFLLSGASYVLFFEYILSVMAMITLVSSGFGTSNCCFCLACAASYAKIQKNNKK